MNLCNVFFAVVFLSGFGICYNYKNSYIAAVVDYAPVEVEYPKAIFSKNLEQYIKLMRNASRQYADIIVFPEFGLVDIYTLYAAASGNVTGLDEFSTFVPDPEQNVVPCDDKKMENYSLQLVQISCAAQIHSLYTVFNLPEKGYNNETGDLEFYNTNVILDRLGTVIAKYRKIHLSEEPFFQPGDKLVTFKTDFNVTFGIFTCFDILFKYPALDVLTIPEVTDIIFPTAWYSETPFLQALSIQHGYAKRNGINFLAAGLQDPWTQDGGSGIYLTDGSIAEVFITKTKQTKIIMQEVPILRNKTLPNSCQQSKNPIRKTKKIKSDEVVLPTDIDDFPISRDNLTGYSFLPLSTGLRTQAKVCSDDEEFCCLFNITANSSLGSLEYTYQLAVYKGVSPFGSKILGGIRVCALLVCLNESESTCGYRTNTSFASATFKSVHIEAIFNKINDSYNQPSTLKDDLTPVSDYIYCETETDNDKINITMATTAPLSSIITFGIYGRLYEDDLVITEPPPPEEIPLDTSLMIVIVSFSTIILLGTAGILWKYCTKMD